VEDPAHEPREKPEPDKNKSGSEQDLWRYVSLGTQLTGTVGVFVLLGWWLDNKYGWSPWGVLISGTLGVAAGMYHFVKDALH
jgi:ATP synthase protein I